MTATEYIKSTRNLIKTFIVSEVRQIYHHLNGEDSEDKEDETYEAEIEGLTIAVEVDNSYLGVEERIYENRSIKKIYVTPDGSVTLEDISGETFDSDTITTDDLAGLSNILEGLRLEIEKSRIPADRQEKLFQKIQDRLVGARYGGFNWAKKELEDIVHMKCNMYASVIDDGVDEDETEDNYVMKDCFEFENSDLTVRIYYGDVTREIGYVEVED